MIPDAVWKNYQMPWKIEGVGRSVSMNAEQTRPDDDDDSHSQNRAIYVCHQLACEGYALLNMDLHHDAYGGFQGQVLSCCCS